MITQRIEQLDKLILTDPLPNEEAARDFLQWAVARQIASWAEKNKGTWDKRIEPRLSSSPGKTLIHDSAFVLVEQNNIAMRSPINEAKLRTALMVAGVDADKIDTIIDSSRGETVQRRFNYTIKV